jgi:hypothetical protein
MTGDGDIVLRDQKLVSLQDRNKVRDLVAQLIAVTGEQQAVVK